MLLPFPESFAIRCVNKTEGEKKNLEIGYPGGPNAIKRILVRGGQKIKDKRRIGNAKLLALSVEERAISQQAPLSARKGTSIRKGKGADSPQSLWEEDSYAHPFLDF